MDRLPPRHRSRGSLHQEGLKVTPMTFMFTDGLNFYDNEYYQETKAIMGAIMVVERRRRKQGRRQGGKLYFECSCFWFIGVAKAVSRKWGYVACVRSVCFFLFGL